MKKRILAVLLCLCMVLTMLPVSALAAVGGLLNNTPEQNETLLESCRALQAKVPKKPWSCWTAWAFWMKTET